MPEHVVIAQLWRAVNVGAPLSVDPVRALQEAEAVASSPAVICANDGVKPRVRVVEQFSFRSATG